MSISVVQSAYAEGGGATTTVSLSSATSPGNRLIVPTGMAEFAESVAVISSISGGGVASWNKIPYEASPSVGGSNTGAVEIWWGIITSGSSSLTVTWNASQFRQPLAAAIEAAQIIDLDNYASEEGFGNFSGVSPLLTPARQDELFVAIYATAGGVESNSVTAGWTGLGSGTLGMSAMAAYLVSGDGNAHSCTFDPHQNTPTASQTTAFTYPFRQGFFHFFPTT